MAIITGEQCQDIERIPRRALRIIYPEMTYDEALARCAIKTLEKRRGITCINLIKDKIDPTHST